MYDKKERLQILVTTESKNFFRTIHPDRGFLTNIINSFLNAIESDCKSSGITYYSPDNLTKLDSIIRQRTAPRPAGDVANRNESRSVERIRQSYKAVKNKSTGVQQTTKVGGKNSRTRVDEEKEIS